MIKITFTKSDLKNLVESILSERPNSDPKALSAEAQAAFWLAFIIPFDGISQKNGLSLPVIYAYTKIKDEINKMHASKEDYITLPEDVFKILHDHFKSFNGWNTSAASIIIMADTKLSALYKEKFPNG